MNDFNWNDFLRLALHLNTDYSFDGQEAVQRTIVSRVYYACFGMAKEVLEHKYNIVVPQNAGSHKYVRCEYGKLGRNDIKNALNDLREYRNCCDYNKNVKDLHLFVNKSLQKSEEIIKNL
jgi:uncharacterized protein (UPF0332 family)